MIRKANKNDIPGVISLLFQVNAVHHEIRPDLFKGNTVKYKEKELAELLNDESKPIFVYVDEDGNILGHAFCQIIDIKNNQLLQDIRTLYIDDICVDENHRRKGVGEALYKHVVEYAKENSFYNITLNVWSCNPGAIKFYESLGFEAQKIGMEKIL